MKRGTAFTWCFNVRLDQMIDNEKSLRSLILLTPHFSAVLMRFRITSNRFSSFSYLDSNARLFLVTSHRSLVTILELYQNHVHAGAANVLRRMR